MAAHNTALTPTGGNSVDPSTWQRVSEIFSEVIDLPAERRAAYLDEVCQEDTVLRQEIDALLAQDDQATAEDFLAPNRELNIKKHLPSIDADPLLETRLGVYELKRRIGQGGMGNVYLAVRTEGYQQRVAIKMLKHGMDSKEILRRFQTEVRVLAALSKHPNIARLIDAATTPDGLPYLVMEYVDGRHIDEYCEQQHLPIRDRLELFCKVCSAVKAAHQHAVIHRDLKPGNILVMEDGGVKLIDFGIAKLVAPELAGETTTPTRTELRPLTPEYASPEQARGDSVTTASDVYSLGVVLFELLTGERPYAARGQSLDKLKATMEDHEPAKPSTTVARSTQAVAARRQQLRGDLDNIVLTALRREPQRRYATVGHLEDDIQRYLSGRPVSARPMGQWERLWYASRRNPVTSSLLVSVLLASFFGLAYLSWLSQHLVRMTAIEGARQQAAMLNAVQEFYSESVVDRAEGQIPITHRYASTDNAIPVPATFTIDLGEYLLANTDSGMRARLYSDAPFKTRASTGGPRDEFERAAIDALRIAPDEPYAQFTRDERGRNVLRYATARTMNASCVQCHNTHPDSPKDDWRIGEFRGVLEITRPLDRDVQRAWTGLRGSFALLIGMTIVLTGMFLVLLLAVRPIR